MIRLSPEEATLRLKEKHVRPMDFTGRPLKGFLYVEAAGVRTADGVKKWGQPRGARLSAVAPSTEPTYFATPAAFRRCLTRHHKAATELLVGFHKKGSGTPSITWPESVDEALCVGWIDGVRRRVDDARYSIRFSPRRAKSIWSAINIARVKVLAAEGRMRPAGLAAFERRDEKKSRYAYEQIKKATFDTVQLRAFKANATAWRFFRAQAPSYRQRCIYYVTSAKQEATRERRLKRLIAESAAGRQL